MEACTILPRMRVLIFGLMLVISDVAGGQANLGASTPWQMQD